jgi:hypothetical protein
LKHNRINARLWDEGAMGITMTLLNQDQDQGMNGRTEAERAALKAAVAESLADPYGLPHEEVAVWLNKLAAGDLKAEMPKARRL